MLSILAFEFCIGLILVAGAMLVRFKEHLSRKKDENVLKERIRELESQVNKLKGEKSGSLSLAVNESGALSAADSSGALSQVKAKTESDPFAKEKRHPSKFC